ncbi:MAG: hypothetical protein KDI79_20625 [Anaerolineae bacterium]|nr:hypothetical protein [Anaerolineae bacterium]
MDDSMQDDLLIIGTILRAIYQKISKAQYVNVEELKNITEHLTSISKRLNGSEDASIVTTEPFEDIIALVWQNAWMLYQGSVDLDSLHDLRDQLRQLHQKTMPNFVVYEALVTEMILHHLGEFAPSIKWCDHFESLDDPTQNKLQEIDEQIQLFTELEFLPKGARLQRLLMVFFDCYFGFQQRQDGNRLDVYRSLIYEPWQRRFRKYKMYQPTDKKFLFTYSAGIDYSMRLNNYWMSKVIDKVAAAEGKSREYLVRELGEFLQQLDDRSDIKMPIQVKVPSDLLKVLLGYLKITSFGKDWVSKFDIRNDKGEEVRDLIDLIDEIVKEVGRSPTLGGAAITGAQALITLGEQDVHLLTPFVSNSLLDQLDPRLRLLWYESHGTTNRLHLSQPLALKKSEQQPEIHNFVIEFSTGTPIVYCSCCGAGVTPKRTDRVILRSRYAYYLSDGRINRALTEQYGMQLKVNDLFGFDSSISNVLSSSDCEALAQQAAAQEYDVLMMAGLQSLDRSVHNRTKKELDEFKKKNTKIHLEVSGDKNFDWLIDLIPEYIFSIGIGEELDLLFQVLKAKKLISRSDSIERYNEEKRQKALEVHLREKPRGYQKVIQALEVASSLGLKRLYVHDIDIDIIVRQGEDQNELSQTQRLAEIQADLIAKWVVLRKLMSRGQISLNQTRDTMTQVKEEGFTALVETAQVLYEEQNSPPSASIELYGTYFPNYKYSVVLVPVRWVYGTMQDQLRIVGAGDTTSIVSAAQAI